MRKKRLFGVLLIITALIIMTLPVSEVDAATSASDFVVEGNRLVKYKGTETEVSIPGNVEIISQSAFEGNTQISRVVIPNSVKRVEAYSFWGCDSLETVVLGNGMKEIGDFTFAGCKGLQQMYIPSNIASIGHQAFGDCVNLKSITIPPETTDIKKSAFDGCANLQINCSEGTAADTYAKWFYEKQKEHAEYEDVPEYGQDNSPAEEQPSVPSGQPDAESGTEQTGALLGSTKVVGNRAMVFVESDSMNVISPEERPVQEQELLEPEELERLAATGKSVPKYTVIDDKIIADQAYYRDDSLQNLLLPEGLIEIGQFAFARSSIKEVIIPEGVTDISYGAFYHCDRLALVKLPESLMNVEPKAFEHTAWVEEFLQSGKEYLISGGTLIAYHGEGGKLTIPEGVRVIASGAFSGQDNITWVSFPDSLRVIGEGCFENCNGITGIELGHGVEQIKDRAFSGCDGLQTVILPASVERLGRNAFGESRLTYEGAQPENTYEISATRLSNEAYRIVEPDNAEPGVRVTGISSATAVLEGAARSYQLNISTDADRDELETAWRRVLNTELPGNMILYEFMLTDNSGIPLTKLGRSRLRVVVPLPEQFYGQKIQMVTMDRNGQLDVLPVEKVKFNGINAFCFETNFVSRYGLYSTGAVDESEEVKEINEDMLRLSSSQETKQQKNGAGIATGIFGISLLLTGLTLLTSCGRKSKKEK